MAKKSARIIALAIVIFIIGILISYYNTASFGYDNATIISFNSEQINVMDFIIKYDKIALIIEKIKEIPPDYFIAI